MSVDWPAIFSSEATVIGLLLAILVAIMLGLLVPVRYVRGLERRLEHQEQTNKDLAESVKVLADWTETQTEVGETVNHTLSTLQKRRQ